MIDHGQDNPLRRAIEQTAGLTIVATRLAYKEPHLELLPGVNNEEALAFLNPHLLFVAFTPPKSLGAMEASIRDIEKSVFDSKREVDELEVYPPAIEPGILDFDIPDEYSFNFGNARFTQTFDEPINVRYTSENPLLASLLEKARPKIFIAKQISESVFYPTIELAKSAVQRLDEKEHQLERPPIPEPLPFSDDPPPPIPVTLADIMMVRRVFRKLDELRQLLPDS